MIVKQWKTGVADNAWKVAISARDAARAEDIAGYLTYIMTSLVNVGFEQQLAAIAGFSGEQIAKALFDQREQAMLAIEAGLSQREAAA